MIITGNNHDGKRIPCLTFSRIKLFLERFNPNPDSFIFYKTTGGAITGFYLDYIKLEIGIEQPVLNQSVILTGDVIGNGVTGVPIPTALKVVNANIGTYGDGTHIAQITVDAKGRVTAVSEVVITPGMSEVETAGSVVGVGDLSDPVTLDGDEDSPGASMYYGTDDSSVPVKGFHALPGAITPTSDAVPVDTDEVVSLRGTSWLKTTWTVLKAFLKTYFDNVYAAINHAHTFLSLTDTPASYAGSGSKIVAVNSLGQVHWNLLMLQVEEAMMKR